MSASLSLAIMIYALLAAAVCAIAAVRGRRRPSLVGPTLVLLEAAALLQAVFDAVDLARGHHGNGVATNVGYLITSLIILPATATAIRLDPGRWGSVGLAFGCVLLAVVSLRLHQTLDTATHA